MATELEQKTADAEGRWLQAWRSGPTRLRWTELPIQVGDLAPDTELVDMQGNDCFLRRAWSEGPALLVFLRQFGCSCAGERMALLQAELAPYQAAGARVVLIGQGEPARTRAFAQRFGVDALFLCDPQRVAYRAYGLLEGRPAQVVYGMEDDYLRCGPEIGRELQQSRHGTERAVVDSPWQLPGEFVVGAHGRVTLAYRSQFCADYADPQVLLAALREDALGL